MNYTDLWPLIQADLLACLQADAFFAGRPGVLIEPGSPEQVLTAKVNAALAQGTDGKCGAGFLVLPIEEAHDDHANLPLGPLKMPVRVQFVENVVVNRGPRGTGIPIRVYAARAEKVLKLYWPVFLAKGLRPQNPVISEFTPERDENLRVGQLNFEAEEDDNTQLIKLPRPQITPNDGQGNGGAHPQTVTITAGGGATAIYYTLDNSHPWSGNPAATLYTSPFNVSTACLVRARAFAAGVLYLGSDTAAVSFV
jgi:hypothetical protein